MSSRFYLKWILNFYFIWNFHLASAKENHTLPFALKFYKADNKHDLKEKKSLVFPANVLSKSNRLTEICLSNCCFNPDLAWLSVGTFRKQDAFRSFTQMAVRHNSQESSMHFTLSDEQKNSTNQLLVFRNKDLAERFKNFLLEQESERYSLALYADRHLNRFRFYIVDEENNLQMYRLGSFLRLSPARVGTSIYYSKDCTKKEKKRKNGYERLD